MQSPFDYFEKTIVINLSHRVDRYMQISEQCHIAGIDFDVFPACEGENKHLAFNRSQYEVIKLASEYNNALILEDDCQFSGTTHLHYAMNELPADWDCLYLGANLIGCGDMVFRRPERFSHHLFKLQDAFQTHAVAYSKKGMEFVLGNFKPDEFPIYDEWLRLNMLPRGNSYIIAPQIAFQRPSYSDIWQNESDYSSLFQRGNNLLNEIK